jgi:hypothetical protein
MPQKHGDEDGTACVAVWRCEVSGGSSAGVDVGEVRVAPVI